MVSREALIGEWVGVIVAPFLYYYAIKYFLQWVGRKLGQPRLLEEHGEFFLLLLKSVLALATIANIRSI